MLKNILKKIKPLIVGDYSPDVAFRYLPVRDILKKEGLMEARILEVGSGDLGITPYIRREVVGLDIAFDRPGPYLKALEYAGSGFPFPNDSFDLVLSVDSLEHVPADQRPKMISEMIRAAGKAVVVVAPCGPSAAASDRELARYFKSIHGKSDKFFDDHIYNGLPEKDAVVKMLEDGAARINKKITIQTRPLLNIRLRRFYMKRAIDPGILPSIIYYSFLLLLPLKNRLNFGRCYRELFYVKIL
ncbi:MAG: class I SAM-dependent methyltransferase [Candidatus Falkowbacteria bacterium]